MKTFKKELTLTLLLDNNNFDYYVNKIFNLEIKTELSRQNFKETYSASLTEEYMNNVLENIIKESIYEAQISKNAIKQFLNRIIKEKNNLSENENFNLIKEFILKVLSNEKEILEEFVEQLVEDLILYKNIREEINILEKNNIKIKFNIVDTSE